MDLQRFETEAVAVPAHLDSNSSPFDASVAGLTSAVGMISRLSRDRTNSSGIDQKLRLQDAFGDLLWYSAHLAQLNGISLDVVASYQLEKLRKLGNEFGDQ